MGFDMKRIKIPPAESVATPIQAIRRRRARIVSYEPGSVWRLNASRVVVIAQVSTTLVRVRHTADDKLEAVRIDSLDPWVSQEGTSEAIRDQAEHGNHSAQVQSRAQLEFSVVSSLVNSGDLSRQAKLRAANSLGISTRHLRTKIQRYLELGSP